MGKRGPKISQKRVTYYLNGPFGKSVSKLNLLIFLKPFRLSVEPVCLIWQKGDGQFQELNPWIARLPEVDNFRGQQFDLHHVLNDTLFFRPWKSREFYKGRIGLVLHFYNAS